MTKMAGFVFAAVVLLSSVSATANEDAWSFIIVGDSRSNGENNGVNVKILGEIANEIVRHQADCVLFVGDLVSGGSSQEKLESQLMTWRQIMQPVYGAGIKVYPVRGNHDLGKPKGSEAWNKVFSGPYALPDNGPEGEKGLTYAMKHKNAIFVGLDQYVNSNRVNQQWLDEQFKNSGQPHTFVFGHVPAFGLEHKDCLDDDPQGRDIFWQSLRGEGVKVYACGHDHFFDHALVDDGDGNRSNDIHQYVVGTGGAPQNKKWSPPYQGFTGPTQIEQQEHQDEYGFVLAEVLNDSQCRLRWYGRDKEAGQYVPSEKVVYIVSTPAAAANNQVSGQ